MKDFAILVDSTSDLNEELRKEYNIDFIPAHYTFDKKEYDCLLSWTKEEREIFFKTLKANPSKFTTSAPNVEEWKQKFKEYATKNMNVLVISLSSALSSTYNIINIAKSEILEEFKDIKIYIVDSHRFSAGSGLLALYCAQLRGQGSSLLEILDYIDIHKAHIHQAGWLDDLNFVAKKGRINKFKAFFGSIAGVKPIGDFNSNGMTTMLGSIRGKKKALNALVKYVKQTIVCPAPQTILIATTDRKDDALLYKEMLEKEIEVKEIKIIEVYQSNSINVGPGLMAAYYIGTPISNLKTEQEIFNNIIKELNNDRT